MSVEPSLTPCQLPKQRRSIARTAARSTSWCASKRMRRCLTSNSRAGSVGGRFKDARAGSFLNTSWSIVQVEGLFGGGEVIRLLRQTDTYLQSALTIPDRPAASADPNEPALSPGIGAQGARHSICHSIMKGSSERSFVCSPVLIQGWSRCWQRFSWSGWNGSPACARKTSLQRFSVRTFQP